MTGVALGEDRGVEHLIQPVQVIGVQLVIEYHLVVLRGDAAKPLVQQGVADEFLLRHSLGLHLMDPDLPGEGLLFLLRPKPCCHPWLEAHFIPPASEAASGLPGPKIGIHHGGAALKVADGDAALMDQLALCHDRFLLYIRSFRWRGRRSGRSQRPGLPRCPRIFPPPLWSPVWGYTR